MANQLTCNHDWREVRGGKAEVCTECTLRFPCQDATCIHTDCMEYRGYAICGVCERRIRLTNRTVNLAWVEQGRRTLMAHPACVDGNITVTIEESR